MSNDKKDDPTTFPEKYFKVIKSLPEFKDTADAASGDDLKKIIISSEGNINSIERDREADVKLNAAKELVKEYSASYREATKVQQAKIKYALFLLEGKGIDVSDLVTSDED